MISIGPNFKKNGSVRGKALLTFVLACCFISTGFASNNPGDNPPVVELVRTVSFSVKVFSGTNSIDGAKVTILQDGVVISSGTTMRGKAQVYIENDKDFTLQVEANGYKKYSKQITAVAQSEVISVSLVKLVQNDKGIKPRK